MKFKLQFQAPPHSHWVLVARSDNRHAEVKAKVFFNEWRSKAYPPRPRVVLPEAHKLREIVKHALALQTP